MDEGDGSGRVWTGLDGSGRVWTGLDDPDDPDDPDDLNAMDDLDAVSVGPGPLVRAMPNAVWARFYTPFWVDLG